jgi:hypothetical protein
MNKSSMMMMMMMMIRTLVHSRVVRQQEGIHPLSTHSCIGNATGLGMKFVVGYVAHIIWFITIPQDHHMVAQLSLLCYSQHLMSQAELQTRVLL